MVEAATEFRKSGFNDEDAANLALVATTYQNVADDAVSASEASSFVIAQMKAFGIEAQNSQMIIDQLNEVSNNYAVSSSQLAQGLNIVSAALSVGGNSYEEVLGLMTAGVEITRNSTKMARGLVSVQSRLNQITDESSSTGKALSDWYEKHGIDVYDKQTGQIKSLYDILTELAPIWDTLSKNEQAYYLNQQAGANQTQNLAAILSNFETATKATATALEDSLGSAIQENARYMESLEARTNQLKATFQDLSNNVIDNELIGALLSLANKGLSLLNTETGTAITQFALLSAGMTGLAGIGQYFVGPILGSFVKGLGGTTKSVIEAATGFQKLGLTLGTFAPYAAILAAIAAGGYTIYKAWDKAHPSLEEANAQLEETETRLEEIGKLEWYDRTPEIQAEEEALRAENEQLKEYIANTEKANKLKAKDTGYTYATGKEYAVVGGFTTYAYVATREEAEKLAKELGLVNYEIQELDKTTTLYGQEAVHHLVENLFDLRNILFKNGKLNDEQYNQYLELISEAGTYADTLEATGQDANALRFAIELLQNQFNKAKEYAQGFNGEMTVTNDGAKQLIELFPELENNLENNGTGWKTLATDISSAASSMISSNGRIYESDKNRVVETIKLLKAEAESHRLVARAKYDAARAGEISYAEVHAAFDVYDAYTSIISELNTALSASLQSGYAPDPFASGGVTTNTATKAADDAQAKLEEIQKAQQEALEQYRQEYERAVQYIIGLINEEITALEEERSVEEEYWDKKIDALNEANEALEDQINLEKLQDNLAKSRQSKVMVYKDGRYQYIQDIDEVSAAQSEIESYNRQKALEEETKRLNELKDESVAVIDKQIAKWQDYAESWEDIVEGYTKEQDKLLAEQHLGINTEKSNWKKRLKNADDFAEEYRDIMEALSIYTTSSFKTQTDALNSLFVEQESLFNNSLKTQENYVKNSIALRDKFNEALLAGEKVGDLGIWLDWEKAAASGGGWTEEEMAQGFLPSTSNVPAGYAEGTTSSGGKTNVKLSTTKYTIAQPSSERRTDLAGQSVKVNGSTVTYGSDGRVTKITKNASGTLSASGGISLVGEQGPELRVLGQGDGIIPADITKNLWAWGSTTPAAMLSAFSGGFGASKNMDITIQNLNLPSVRDGNDFVQYMKNNFWRHTVQFATT